MQSIHDAIPVEEKKLVWIEGTTRRFDGYNYFGEHPEVAIDWFNSGAAQRLAPHRPVAVNASHADTFGHNTMPKAFAGSWFPDLGYPSPERRETKVERCQRIWTGRETLPYQQRSSMSDRTRRWSSNPGD